MAVLFSDLERAASGWLEEPLDPLRETSVKRAASLLARATREAARDGGRARVMFVCTHNSRRSQLAQAWMSAMAHRFDLPLDVFSGGTEPIPALPPAIGRALAGAGFVLGAPDPRIDARFARQGKITLWSKRYDDPSNPRTFVAIVNCSTADESCPILPGSLHRIALLYRDPRTSDGTPSEQATYDATSASIGHELAHLARAVRDELDGPG